MERLPPGHPSSPYNDDMTPKPPVARLKNLELPLNGTEHSGRSTEQSGRSTEQSSTSTEPSGNGASASTPPAPARNGRASANPPPPDSTSVPAASSTSAPAASSTSAPAASSTSAPVAGSTDDPALDATGPAPESTTTPAGSNGASGRNSVASTLGTAERLLTRARLISIAEPYEATKAPEGIPGGMDDDGPDAPGGPDRGSGEGSGWLSTPTWADTDLGAADAAAEPASREGLATWTTTDWDDAPDATGSNGAGDEWGEPEPAADTLTHATIDAGPGHPAGEPLTGPDGSWEWNGRYLTPEESRIADEALGRCRIAEGRNVFGGYGHSGLTPAMRRIEAQLEHGQLLPDTENTALKPADSFKEKLADLIMRHPDKSAEELALDVHDGIRYAFIFDTDHYADGTLQAHSRLKGNGFDLEVRRNCWQSPEYKGINCRWRDPAHDLVFEVQFHTAASWDVSQRCHGLYEAITDAATPPEERARLRSIYADMSAAIPVPRGCTTIPDYRKES
jgi:hypothetical protein